jgi:putative GTP pyrophosphokinase
MTKEETILAEFELLKNDLKVWGKYVDSKLVDLIKLIDESEYILKIKPSFRLKDDISYIEKALFRKKQYDNPIINIEDKIGTRVVLLKSSDVEIVSDKILNSDFWNSKVTKSRNNEIEDKPTIFDYQSQHIVVWPKENYLSDNTKNALLTCEIQIRTLLQHAFAEVSHDSTYKGPYKNDSEIIRQLSKSMALMEATDDYFCKIFEMMNDDGRKYYHYLKELERIYLTELKGADSKTVINYELSDSLISLIDCVDIPISFIESFVIKHSKELKSLVSKNNNLLLSQPIFVFLYYMLANHRNLFEENWPLNKQSLSDFKNLLGYSSSDF